TSSPNGHGRMDAVQWTLTRVDSVPAFVCEGYSYAWGDNGSGQLGLGDKQKRLAPTLVKALQNVDVLFLAAGKSHTIAVTDDGGVYTWGDGSSNQLGHASKQSFVEPVKIESMGALLVRSAAATDEGSIVIVEGG